MFVTFAGINTCSCVEFINGGEGTKYLYTEFDDDPNATFELTLLGPEVPGVTSWDANIGNVFICISPTSDPVCEGCSRAGFPEPPPGHTWELVAVKALVQCGPAVDGGNAFAIAIYGISGDGRVIILFDSVVYDDATTDCLPCWELANSAACGETGTLSNPMGQTAFWKVGLDGSPYLDVAQDGVSFVTAV